MGIEMKVKAETRELFTTRFQGNEPDAVVWGGDGGLFVILQPGDYFPGTGEAKYAMPWYYWFTNPKNPHAIKPPAPARKQMNLYRQLQVTVDPKVQNQLMGKILKIAQEQFWEIGIALPTQSYGVVSNRFHNVPKEMVGAWLYPVPAPTNPCQYFIEEA